MPGYYEPIENPKEAPKESTTPTEVSSQSIPNQQNQTEKENQPKEAHQTKSTPKKEIIDSSKNEASRKYENSGPGTQINIEEMKAPLTLNTVEPPPPTFKLINLVKTEGRFFNYEPTNRTTEFKFKILIEFSYSSKQPKNELSFAFGNKNVYHIQGGYKEGSSTSFIGRVNKDKDGNTKICNFQSPLNGVYEVEILLNEDIPNPLDLFLIRVDRDLIYRLTK